MGLLNLIRNICNYREVFAVRDYDLLTNQLSQNKSQGLNDIEAGTMLLIQQWGLPQTNDAIARASFLSKNLGELVIGFIMFSKRIRVWKFTKTLLTGDPFFNHHGCLYVTATPLTDFARKHMNRIWNHQRVDPADASDAAFAAYYATLFAPFAVDAWLMLAELKQLGFCPDIDNRDHIKEGIENTCKFLETANKVDPEFCTLLNNGVQHLRKMES